MPRRDGRSRLLSEEASPAAMELVARALGTPTADEFGQPWVGMPDEFAADSAAQIQAAFRGLLVRRRLAAELELALARPSLAKARAFAEAPV